MLNVPQIENATDHRNKKLIKKNPFQTKSRFRWDYFDKYHEKSGGKLVGFQKFMDAGVRSEYLKSVFPAESLPAWQTIQTGLFCFEKNLLWCLLCRPLPGEPWNCWEPILRQRGDFFYI